MPIPPRVAVPRRLEERAAGTDEATARTTRAAPGSRARAAIERGVWRPTVRLSLLYLYRVGSTYARLVHGDRWLGCWRFGEGAAVRAEIQCGYRGT